MTNVCQVSNASLNFTVTNLIYSTSIMLHACSIRITTCKSLNCNDFESVWTVKLCGLDDRKLSYLCGGILICHDMENGCEAYLLGGCDVCSKGNVQRLFFGL